jgi:hypothetical protein
MRSKYFKYAWIVVIPLLIIGLGWIGWVYKNNVSQAKELQKAEQGTTVRYEEGDITKTDFGAGKDYTNKLLPKLKIKSQNTSWRVTEDNKSNDKKLNLVTLIRGKEDTLVLSSYSNNGGLKVGAQCFAVDDLVDLENGWIREKMVNETGSDQIGVLYVRKDRYTYTSSSDFTAVYDTYFKYHTENKLPILDKSKTVACGTAPRVNITQTTIKTPIEGNSEFGTALLRISVNDSKITPERLKVMDELVARIEF